VAPIKPAFLGDEDTFPVTYGPVDLRLVTSAILGGRSFDSLAPGTGMIGRGHGVLSGDSMLVTASPTPDNHVHVAPGIAACKGTQTNGQGTYTLPLSSSYELDVPPKDASLTTNHYVVAQVLDDAYAAHEGDIWEPQIVPGTPGGGNPSIPEDCVVLARLTIPGGTTPAGTVVESTHITDMRPHARAAGAITPVSVRGDFPNPTDGDAVWEISTDTLLMRRSGAWVEIAKNLDANWNTYSPTWGGVVLGNGSRYGRWRKMGRTVEGVAGFDLGTSAGGGNVTGGITCTLPAPAYNPGTNVRYLGRCRGRIGTGIYTGTAEIDPSIFASLIFNFAGDSDGLTWDTNNPANWGATGVPSFNVSQMRLEFEYEAA
jgi:hypothetical protein